MSRHQKPDPLVLALSPREWAPLEEAFNRIKAWIGSTELTERDLHQDLLTGRLKSAVRCIEPDGTETRIILEPAFWRWPPANAGVSSLWTDWWKGRFEVGHLVEGRIETKTRYFFVRRCDVDKFYPIATSSGPQPSPRLAAKEPVPPDGPKSGSADAWIDELFPNGEWRLMTAKQVHDGIAREAEKRGLKKWPSYSAVLLELRTRRQQQKTQK
jgi:hypothetical protein